MPILHLLPCHDPIPSSTRIHGATVALIQSRMHPSRFKINRIKSLLCASNLGVVFFANVTDQNIHDAHRFGSFVVVGQNEQIKDLVRPWTKKLYLLLLPYPHPPIRLVVVAAFREGEFQKLVVEVVVVFSRL